MSSRARVLFVVSGYLLIASVALLAWLSWRVGGVPPIWALALGLSPAPVYLLAGSAARERQPFLSRSTACFGLLPALLLTWGATQADDLASTAPAQAAAPTTPDLDLPRLFAGARSTHDVPGHGGILLMRRGEFPDGSEISFLRFTNDPQADAHLAFLTRAHQGRPASLSDRQGVRLVLSPERYAYVEQHGRDLVQVKARDETQGLSRLQTQGVPVPAPEFEEPAAAGPAPVWPFALSYALVHALALAGFIAWTGSRRLQAGEA